MLAVLRGELAATSFGGEVYLAALFLPVWRRILAPLTTRRTIRTASGSGAFDCIHHTGKKTGARVPISLLAKWEGQEKTELVNNLSDLPGCAALAGGGQGFRFCL
jgi:hypothetical protein